MSHTSNELVSIIMPMYNCEQFIADTIESVLAQTYQNWELLIIDDVSNDCSVEIAKQYSNRDKRIKLLSNDVNCGAAVSRNYALREAKGKWIAFLDSDDIWYTEKLEKQIEFMSDNNYHFSYTLYSEINENGTSRHCYWTGPKKITKTCMYTFNYMGCLTVMYDKEYVGLIQIENLSQRNDYAIWIKVIEKCPAYLLNEILAKYRIRTSGSIMNRKKGSLSRIKSNYYLWRIGENMNPLFALFWTCVNLIFGTLKKLLFKRKYNRSIDT